MARSKMAGFKNCTNLGFEVTLCATADKLPGSMQPDENRHVLPAQVFLDYTTDAFEEQGTKIYTGTISQYLGGSAA